MNLAEFRDIHLNDAPLSNQEIIDLFLPLFRKLTPLHDQYQVANIRYIDRLTVKDFELQIDESAISEPKLNTQKITSLQPDTSIFEVTKRTVEQVSIGEGDYSYQTGDFMKEVQSKEDIKRPVYLLGYKSYEEIFDHYDPKTELFICGLLMASFAFNLDFSDEEDVKTFATYHNHLYSLNPQLHPTILNAITQLTDLDRNKRTRETRALIWKLENYNDYNTDYEEDILNTEGFKNQNDSSRNSWVLNQLKSRLFELSRRNKLLYFQPASKFLNLTVASVPTILHYEKIKEKDLFLWNEEISKIIKKQGKIALNKYLRLDESRYISVTLDKIRSNARKDLYEYGFSQLKLVLAFLNWYNFKENKSEKIKSPLLILPVTLSKKKGVTDVYELACTSAEAEINPVLKHQLKELFDIDLPQSIDLEVVDLLDFYQKIQAQIEGKNKKIALSLIDKPKIRLIQNIAKNKISTFDKRSRRNTSAFKSSKFDYSYQKDNYKPLGLEIYKSYVRPEHSYLEYIIDDDIKYQSDNFAQQKNKEFYSIDTDGSYNPYNWEFDICNITLGNFNYKKMSLVRDYDIILENPNDNQVFTQLFSDLPKALEDPNEVLPSFEDNFYILNADATQAKAISKARSGKSLIIQGPPGTGKSQTITNLIADFASRNKRVLFVCEKRAALDVVYARLKSKKLHTLTSLVHDSQSDKKEFVMDTKATYEEFINEDSQLSELQSRRDSMKNAIKMEIQKINQYHQIMTKVHQEVGITLFEFIDHILENRKQKFDAVQVVEGIDYAQWIEAQDLLDDLSKALSTIGSNSEPTQYALKTLSPQALEDKHRNQLSEEIQSLKDTLQDLKTKASQQSFDALTQTKIDQLLLYAQLSNIILQLKPVGKEDVFDQYSAAHHELKQMNADIIAAQSTLDKAREQNQHWTQKLNQDEAASALDQLSKLEGKFYAFIIPKYRRLKKVLKKAYNFEAHQVTPTMTKVLSQLLHEYQSAQQVQDAKQKAQKAFNTDDFETFKTKVNELKNTQIQTINKLQQYNTSQLETLKKLEAQLPDLLNQMDFVGICQDINVQDASEQISQINEQLNTLTVLAPYLRAFQQKSSPSVQAQIRSNTQPLKANKSAIIESTLLKLYDADITIVNAVGYALQYSIDQIMTLHQDMLELNSKYLVELYKDRFKAQLTNAQLTADQQEEQGKIDKKVFNKARKILENEFNKKMRYKSIRDLKTLESSFILDLIKPIWLMSPLSVSDTLPVDPSQFDVVIFDEASQITLEEGVPTLFRSHQAIIVGDEKQMPPTNFFSATTTSKDEDEDDENAEKVVIDADSMLTHATKKLEDVMLSWHYRSLYESLIGFSNAAFYGGNLLTIPDPEVLVHNPALNETTPLSQRLQHEVISFHFQEDGIYHKRQNTTEANTIAQMVKDLIINRPNLSIGVVAFSQQQQEAIEGALVQLANDEPDFAPLLEEAYTKTEDEQHVGLFVKNLENVQGDERDVIIISVCYGYNEKGKMLMNFGPINRKGGEKRLNVIFSRSKRHMAIVSSIHYHDITNEYNEGANYLRTFLQFAEATSKGQGQLSAQILDGMSKELVTHNIAPSIVAHQLQDYLKSIGFESNLDVGLSKFKISIGVKSKTKTNKYLLGILLDNDSHYHTQDIVDQYVLRPNLLRVFGWHTIQIYKKDWLENPDTVKNQLKTLLENIRE